MTRRRHPDATLRHAAHPAGTCGLSGNRMTILDANPEPRSRNPLAHNVGPGGPHRKAGPGGGSDPRQRRDAHPQRTSRSALGRDWSE